ncbi:MAG: hypothetical protein WC242_00195 [Candidatus Paceibacterota bacterium]|jgi:hypothetical protein
MKKKKGFLKSRTPGGKAARQRRRMVRKTLIAGDKELKPERDRAIFGGPNPRDIIVDG